MRIVEEFVLSKMANKMHCEDGIYYDDNFVVLIDGVTSKTNLLLYLSTEKWSTFQFKTGPLFLSF